MKVCLRKAKSLMLDISGPESDFESHDRPAAD